MSNILSTIGNAVDLSKKLLELANSAKDVEAKLLIANLQVELAELKTSLADLIDENRELKRKISNTAHPEVEFRDEVYFLKENDDGPYCTSCFDSNKQLIRLTKSFDSFFGKLQCNVCESFFQKDV